MESAESYLSRRAVFSSCHGRMQRDHVLWEVLWSGSMMAADWSERKGDKMASVLKVKGMSCQHCVMSVTKALNQLEGVQNIEVDLQKGEVRFDNTKGVASDRIAKAIADAGYEVVSA